MEQTLYSFTIGLYQIRTNTNTEQGPTLIYTDNGIINKNLFVPSARTSNYGLKQLRENGPRIWN